MLMKTEMMMRKLSPLAMMAIALFASCKSDKKHPGWEYMPDMYRTAAIKTYRVSELFSDSVSALLPVEGTIPRGINNYFPYPNTNEGYEAAGATWFNPLPLNDTILAQGKELYRINCQHCHGEKGDGKGTLRVKDDPFPVPSYFDDTRMALKEGHMFFSITYGKNLMGPHASLLNQQERWKVIHYIRHLQNNYLAEKNKTAAVN
jgi:mono/diheme cytochrome c family protein